MKIVSIVLGLCLIATFAFAETYTGKAENIEIKYSKLKGGSNVETAMGIGFDVVITDSQQKEVCRIAQYIGAGTMTGVQVKNAVKNVVERFVQDIYAHVEGAKEAFADKTNLEKFTASCNQYVETVNRPNPQDPRP